MKSQWVLCMKFGLSFNLKFNSEKEDKTFFYLFWKIDFYAMWETKIKFKKRVLKKDISFFEMYCTL